MKREESRHISAFIRQFVKDNHLEEGLMQCRISDAWDEVVKKVTEGVYPPEKAVKFTSGKHFKDGTLTCRINSSMVRMQFQMNSRTLLEMLNKALGEPLVKKIIFS